MVAMLFSPKFGTVEGIPRLEGGVCIPQRNKSVVSRYTSWDFRSFPPVQRLGLLATSLSIAGHRDLRLLGKM